MPARAAAAANAEPGPHRFSLGAGLEAIAPGVDRDANWGTFGLPVSISAGYAYRLLPWLELGANAAYDYSLEDKTPDVFLPALSLRAAVPVAANRVTELGLSGRAGLLYMGFRDYDLNWRGSAFSVAFDVRHCFASRWAGQLSIELTRGSASRTPLNAKEDYTSNSDPTYAALGLWARVLFMP